MSSRTPFNSEDAVQQPSIPHAADFARYWTDAWNARDLEAILDLFSEDARFTSPYAAKLLPDTGGVLNGKTALRDYWTLGLATIPELQFELEKVFAGVDSLVIVYRNHSGTLVSEAFRFLDGKVIEASGNYAAD